MRSLDMATSLRSDDTFQKARAWVSAQLSPQEQFTLERLIAAPQSAYPLAEAIRKAKPLEWGNASNATVSKNVSKIRARFGAYALSSHGIRDTTQFTITEGREYTLVRQVKNLPAATHFWLGHLENDRRTSIVVGNASRSFGPKWRQLQQYPRRVVNGVPEPEPIDVDRRELPPPPQGKLEALLSGDPYRTVRLGDVRALLSVYSYFKSWSDRDLGYREPELINCETADQLSEDHLVVIGSSVLHFEFEEWRWDSRFNLYLLGGMNLFENHCDGLRSGFGCRNGQTESYVLVSRSSTGTSGRTITLINGPHSLATAAVCQLLTNDHKIEMDLINKLNLRIGEGASSYFPADFQLVFEATLSDDESRVESLSAERLQTLEKRPCPPGCAIRVIE